MKSLITRGHHSDANLVVSTAPSDGLAPLGASISSGTGMRQFDSSYIRDRCLKRKGNSVDYPTT